MKRRRFLAHELSFLVLVIALCLVAGSVDARETDVTWPINVKLVVNYDDNVQTWDDVGDVVISNDRNLVTIFVDPYDGYMINKAGVHVVNDPDLFEDVLDNKGQPKMKNFTYVKDYIADFGGAVPDHTQTIEMDLLDMCWSVKPEICDPFRYILVAVELEGIKETAYAQNGGIFDRYTPAHYSGLAWGWYVSYPVAKSEPGHFVDANVNGMTYWTPTHHGITGSEGQFWFLPNETVEFAVGSVFLGAALADRGVTPVDLFVGADMDDDRVANVARLLQSLDGDGNPAQGSINITDPVIGCLETALTGLPPIPEPELFFSDDAAVGAVIDATIAACAGQVALVSVTKEEALDNLNTGLKAGNLMKKNVSKNADMKVDKAKLDIMPVYVPATTSDGSSTAVNYYDADGAEIETRYVAKPVVVTYLEEVPGTNTSDVFVAISRDDGDTWNRRNISKTADKISRVGTPGVSQKPMLKVKDNMIFVAWTDKYCNGGRPGYAITVCPDDDGDGTPDECEICRDTDQGTVCFTDYPGDDAYWRDDIFGVGGPHRSVTYDDYPEMGEVAYSCVWTSRAVIESDGTIQWFKPERLTSGRRDAFQLFAGAGQDVAFAIVWQEDSRGLMPGDGDGPGEGWSGANTHNKTDIWYSYITMSDFALIDDAYPIGGHGDNDDLVDMDPELRGRVKALVPMSLPVRISDNEICSLENMDPEGGHGEHDFDGEGQGTHRYCGNLDEVGTVDAPGSNPLCAYTFPKANPRGEVHNVCVTADGRLLDGNTGASRPNIFLQPFKKPDDSKSAWVIVGYEEGKGVGIPPEGDHDDDGCGTDDGTDDGLDDHDITAEDDHDDDRYKPDVGKNVIYHSFVFDNPETVAGGGIINLPETDDDGNLIYLVDEFGAPLLDWKGEPQLDYENARRVRFVTQPKSKAGTSKTVLVALYRQGREGSGKPADIFARRVVSLTGGNPYAFGNFVTGAQNLSSVEPTVEWQNPFDAEAPVKMLRWGWSTANLADSSADTPYDDARAHRGALDGDDLIIGYSWTPNWGRNANDKYDLLIRRSFNGGQSWTTDPNDLDPIEHNVVFRVPIEDDVNQTVIWDEEVVTTVYAPGALEPPRNVSNLRNNRISVLEPRLVKTPGAITSAYSYPEDTRAPGVFQLAYGIEFNQNQAPNDVVYPKMPMDIYYSRTMDKGQRYESVVVTPQKGTGQPQEGWNLLAKDQPEQGAAQLRQTPDGSRMYSIWLENSDAGSDVMFRRVDYRGNE